MGFALNPQPGPSQKCLLDFSCAEQEDGRQLAESFHERQLRIRVFDRDTVPWYFGVSLYIILLSTAAAGIPLVYPEVSRVAMHNVIP